MNGQTLYLGLGIKGHALTFHRLCHFYFLTSRSSEAFHFHSLLVFDFHPLLSFMPALRATDSNKMGRVARRMAAARPDFFHRYIRHYLLKLLSIQFRSLLSSFISFLPLVLWTTRSEARLFLENRDCTFSPFVLQVAFMSFFFFFFFFFNFSPFPFPFPLWMTRSVKRS